MVFIRQLLVITTLMITLFFSRDIFAAKLTVVTEHLAPFQIVSKEKITGFATEIVEAMLEHSKLNYELVAHSWSVSFYRAQKEKNTCIFSLSRIPERESLFQWLGHIGTSTISLYGLKSSPISISNLNDAKKYKIAVIKDDVTHHFLLSKGFVENENLYVMANNKGLLKLLEISNRNIDLVVLNDDLLHYRVNKQDELIKYKNFFQLKNLMLDFYFACSLTTEQSIIQQLSDSMTVLEQRGDFDKIRQNWQKKMKNLLQTNN